MNEFFEKIQSFIISIPSSIKKMSVGKKIYVTLWTLSLSLIFVIIGMVAGLRDELNSSKNKLDKIQIVAHKSSSDKIKALDKPDKKTRAEKAKDKTKYFVQAKADSNDKMVLKNHFYSVSDIEEIKKNKGLFDFTNFYVDGFNEKFVRAKENAVKAKKGSTISLKDLYDKNPNEKDLEDYDLANPFYKNEGFALYDQKLVLTDKAKAANNATAAMGGLFLLGVTSAIIATVIESKKSKKLKEIK